MPSGPTVSPPGTAVPLSAAGSGMLKKVRWSRDRGAGIGPGPLGRPRSSRR